MAQLVERQRGAPCIERGMLAASQQIRAASGWPGAAVAACTAPHGREAQKARIRIPTTKAALLVSRRAITPAHVGGEVVVSSAEAERSQRCRATARFCNSVELWQAGRTFAKGKCKWGRRHKWWWNHR
eukprot:scaffold307300_cov32-Tisochrysis_lutea.AAC.2